jgi:hypothetical protein
VAPRGSRVRLDRAPRLVKSAGRLLVPLALENPRHKWRRGMSSEVVGERNGPWGLTQPLASLGAIERHEWPV